MPGTGVPANYLRDSWVFSPLTSPVRHRCPIPMKKSHEDGVVQFQGFFKASPQGKSWETFNVSLFLEWRQDWCLSAVISLEISPFKDRF